MTDRAPALAVSMNVSPVPTDEEAAVIVASIDALWPRVTAPAAATAARDRSWRFSGRWWSRPVAVRRDRPFR